MFDLLFSGSFLIVFMCNVKYFAFEIIHLTKKLLLVRDERVLFVLQISITVSKG